MSDTPANPPGPLPALSLSQAGGADVKRLGTGHDGWRDVYYAVLIAPWRVFYAVLIGLYLTANCLFATLYSLQPGCVAEVHPGRWLDDFFFSFETMATVGYGVMHPVTLYAHWLVVCEIMFGVLLVPLATGLIITKFARPTARVSFSNNILIATYDGVPTLMFRAANIRTNQIYEAKMSVTLLRAELTAEGRPIRRLVDMKLVRDTSPMFILSWMVMHRIDADSPLYGVDFAVVAPGSLNVLTVMTGLDATASATVHARHMYGMEDLLIDHMFEDVIITGADGQMAIDYSLLHNVRPIKRAT